MQPSNASKLMVLTYRVDFTENFSASLRKLHTLSFAKSILFRRNSPTTEASLENKEMETDRSIRWKRSSNPLVYHDIDAFRSKVELRQRLTKFKFQAKRYQTIAHQTAKNYD